MKKNVMMRVASIMLVLVLMTSSVISGTFAKYVTEGSASDSARVAKWGVVVTGYADMFKTEYAKNDETFTLDTNTVVSADTINGRNRLLAPGTEGKLTDVALSGTPEVAVRVTYDATFDIGGWNLNGVAYYCPIIIMVEGEAICGLDFASEAAFEAKVEATIEKHAKDYKANTNLASVGDDAPSVSWGWAFDEAAHNSLAHGHGDGKQTDAYDTILGNQAAKGSPAYIDLTVVTTVTQID